MTTPSSRSLDIRLQSQALQGEEVLVTAENLQTVEVSPNPAQIHLSPRLIASLPSVGEVDIFRSLQLLPGISGVNDGSSGLYIRGGTPEQNLVLFDGMTIYHVDHFFGFISAFNAGTEDPNTIRRNFGSTEENRIIDFTLRFDSEWQLYKSHRVEFGSWFSRTNVRLGFFANDTLEILRRDDQAVQSAFYLQDKWQILKPPEPYMILSRRFNLRKRSTIFDKK